MTFALIIKTMTNNDPFQLPGIIDQIVNDNLNPQQVSCGDRDHGEFVADVDCDTF